MQTKLTLRMESKIIEKAKRISKRKGKSISQIVSEYFVKTEDAESDAEVKITSKVRKLRGILKGADIAEEDHKGYLEKKHK